MGRSTPVNIHDAKTQFSKLVERVEAGEEIVITRAGRPVARLIPFRPRRKRRKLGTMRGKIVMAPDFDAPLPPDIQKYFDGDGEDEM